MLKSGLSQKWQKRICYLAVLQPIVRVSSSAPIYYQHRAASGYPYGGAKIDGLPGSQVGNVRVPAVGDVDHQYQDPPAGAFRGPCPGLNAAANHGFLSRDGIVTFNELVAAQQNVYNVGYDLAVVLATLGVGLDGEHSPVWHQTHVTTGINAKWTGDLTAGTLSLGSKDKGLAIHGKFEADASLTRNDYYTNAGGMLYRLGLSVTGPDL